MVDKMLQVDPEKRCSIADLRQHPWFLMEYTELATTIEAQPEGMRVSFCAFKLHFFSMRKFKHQPKLCFLILVPMETITKCRNECVGFADQLDALEKEKEAKQRQEKRSLKRANSSTRGKTPSRVGGRSMSPKVSNAPGRSMSPKVASPTSILASSVVRPKSNSRVGYKTL